MQDLPHVTSANCWVSNLRSEADVEKQSLQGTNSFTYLRKELLAVPKCLSVLQVTTWARPVHAKVLSLSSRTEENDLVALAQKPDTI